jgi:hypothetical protein
MGTAWMRQARDRQRAFVQSGDQRRFGDQRDQARQAYGEWFGALPWDLYATFTVVLGARESAPFIWRALRRWSRVMHRECGRELRQVAALEWQDRGTAHLHNLVAGCGAYDPFRAMAHWEEASGGGIARIFPYRESGGAATYCSKYVVKDMELRLIGPWPAWRAQPTTPVITATTPRTAS